MELLWDHLYVGLNTPVEFMKTLYTINTNATIILDTMRDNFKTIDLTDEEEIEYVPEKTVTHSGRISRKPN